MPDRVSRQQCGKGDCQIFGPYGDIHLHAIANETADSWNQQATDAVEDIGRRICVIIEKNT